MIMFRHLIKYFYLFFYNIYHKTKIKSIKASLHASYGKGVLIDQNTIIEEDVVIGDYSYVNKNSSIENCTVGKFCSISSGVYVCPFEHDLKAFSTHPFFENKENRSLRRKKVHIGNDVLISLNAIILEGVNIGDGAVIAAGAVVTNDVKPYEIVGGVPARHLRYRFCDSVINYFEKEKWWEWDIEKIKNTKALSDKVKTYSE